MSCIWRFIYRDLLQPGDTFPIMMRKLVIAVSGILGFVAVYGVMQKLMSKQANTSTTYIIIGSYLSLMVTFFGSWIYVKWTHTAPSWLIAFWIHSVSVTVLLFMLCNPNYPWEFTLIAIIFAASILKVNTLNLITPITALFVFGYNFSLGRMGFRTP